MPEDKKFTNLSVEEEEQIREIVADKMLDIVWNDVYYLSSFTSTSVDTSSSTETTEAKEVDTSEGKKFDPAGDTRFRMNFYLNSGQKNITAYILSPATSTDDTFATDVPIATNTDLSYVGIKMTPDVTGARVNLVSSVAGEEEIVKTEKILEDNTTHVVEINYRAGESADIYFDNLFLGSIRSKIDKSTNIFTYYPFLTSVKSDSGSVNFTIESYEFAQVKSKTRR